MSKSNLKLAAERKNAPLVELGDTGLHRQGGHIFEEWLPQLRGSFWAKVVREMSENDPVIGAILRAVEMLTRQVEFRVDPGSEDKEGEADAQFVEECRNDMSATWQEILAEILSMLPWGWSWLEQVYKVRNGTEGEVTSKYSDGRIGWRKWSIRSQDSLSEWVFDDEGGIQAMVQRSQYDFQARTIPIEKSLLFRTTSRKNNPEGYSILRSAFVPWYRKTNIERIEAIGIERDLVGYPVMRVPSEIITDSANVNTYTGYKEMVTNIRRDELEGAVIPSDTDEHGNEMYSLSLLTSGGTRQMNTGEIIIRYDTRIAMSMLADFMMLGHEKVGSFALASSKTNLFTTALGAYLDSICEVINRHAIPRLMKLNGRPTDSTPKLVHGDIETVDLAELGTFIKELSGAGFTEHLAEDVQREIMKRAGLPVPADEEEANAPKTEPVETDLEDDVELPGN
jgi:hypothetical protein